MRRILASIVPFAVAAVTAAASLPVDAQTTVAPNAATRRDRSIRNRCRRAGASPRRRPKAASAPFARPDAAQKTGIIIVGGRPAAPR